MEGEGEGGGEGRGEEMAGHARDPAPPHSNSPLFQPGLDVAELEAELAIDVDLAVEILAVAGNVGRERRALRALLVHKALEVVERASRRKILREALRMCRATEKQS